MISGYLDTLGGGTTVTVAGLPPNPNGYTVYLYTDGDNGPATRVGRYQIGATAVNVTDTGDFAGAFGAGNSAVFNVAGTGFTLTATPVSSTDPWLRAPVNGIQIVPAGSVRTDGRFLRDRHARQRLRRARRQRRRTPSR